MSDPAAPEQEGSTVIIGGIDLKDLKHAYGQHPRLKRWEETSEMLISELYWRNQGLGAECERLSARVEELELEASVKDRAATNETTSVAAEEQRSTDS